MFINFWYVADEVQNVRDEPIIVRMLGQDFVLFKDSSDNVHCLSNVCTHRGGSLAQGKVKGDCIECPYHGWQFDGEGLCRRIPSMGKDAKIPNRAKLDAYPTQEKFGLIFVFLGDLPQEERPPIMEIPEFNEPGWRSTCQSFQWDCDYKRSIENGIDIAHNGFIHTTHIQSTGNENYTVPDLELVDTKWGTGFYNSAPSEPLAKEKMRKVPGIEDAATTELGTGHHGISSLWTFIHPTPDFKIHQYLYETPIDDGSMRLFVVNLRNFMTEPRDDTTVMERNAFFAYEDRDVLLEIRPKLMPETNTKEVFVPADKPIARYRERVKEWEARGWRIDSDEVRRTADKVVYAIPSPARRLSKGWVLDPVPLRPAGDVIMADAAE